MPIWVFFCCCLLLGMETNAREGCGARVWSEIFLFLFLFVVLVVVDCTVWVKRNHEVSSNRVSLFTSFHIFHISAAERHLSLEYVSPVF